VSSDLSFSDAFVRMPYENQRVLHVAQGFGFYYSEDNDIFVVGPSPFVRIVHTITRWAVYGVISVHSWKLGSI
jgi:hypothetical protein